MNTRTRLLFAGLAFVAGAGGALLFGLNWSSGAADVTADPRTATRLVRIADAALPAGSERAFTGLIAARVQSNLGFRVPGKVVERLVDVGQQVLAGQPLMRIDETNLRLALTSKKNAALAARANAVQARLDEKRYAILSKDGVSAPLQRYEQAKAALDTTEAQLAAAEADARVAENELGYSTLYADADGTVVATLGEPGQVVVAGQTVVQLAQAGPREALVALPEMVRPQVGSVAEVSVYGLSSERSSTRLRQISDAADPQTRTYEARYVLEGNAATTPLGATVTIRIPTKTMIGMAVVPVGAIHDNRLKSGVWVLDRANSTVHFRQVTINQLANETAIVSGVSVGEPVVALGAHLLTEGAKVRTSVVLGSAKQ